MELRKQNASLHQNYNVLAALLFWCGLVIVASNYFTIPLLVKIFKQALLMLLGQEVRSLYVMQLVLYFLVHYLIILDENKSCFLDY